MKWRIAKEIIKRGCIFASFVGAFWIACLVSSISLVFGCASVPREDAERIFEKIEKEFGKHSSSDAGAKKSSADPTGDGRQSASAPASGTLVYRYGGFHGENATEDSRCRISDLKVGSSGLSFKWQSDIPSDWKRQKDKKGSFVIAAVFFMDSTGTWVGGKFDLIDRARSTRDFANIDGGYNGWNASAFHAAKRYAFCILSADGRHRTNLLETTEP